MSARTIQLTRDVSFGILVLFFCLFLLSFITPYWFHKQREMTELRVFHGLWRICDLYLKACFYIVGSALNKTWLKWTQALMILALFAYSASVAFYSHWMTKPLAYFQKQGLGWAGGISAGACIVAGLLNTAAVVVFGLHYEDRDFYADPYGWSFVLACVCGAVTLLLGFSVLVVVAFFGKRNDSQPEDNDYVTPTEQSHN